MNNSTYKKYEGKSLESLVRAHTFSPQTDDTLADAIKAKSSEIKEDILPYYPSDDLKDAVEYARLLKRPLLLRGEPGCGKTRLAQALAYELYPKNEHDNYRNHYFEWFVKSYSKAKDGLYQFDHLARLRDIQAEINKDIHEYRSFGPLGRAFLTSKPEAPSVLLIDEIDKADIDFPNDLLLELDQQRFFIQETKEEIRAEYAPIVIITSNDEKELPSAFLRRCVFHYIDTPDREQLLRILKAKAEIQADEYKKALPERLVESIVDSFLELLKQMRSNPTTDKKTSTSELLDWLRVIHYKYLIGELQLEDDRLPKKDLLYPEVLLKSLDDYKKFAKKAY